MEPRTPLRRISRGSLSALSRSATHSHSHPSTLGIPDSAFNDLADEIEHLQVNVEGLRELDKTLREFNEGFSSFLWSMRMNAFLTEWHQVPSDDSFKLAAERQKSSRSNHARKASEPKPSHHDGNVSETTFANYTTNTNPDPESTMMEQPSGLSLNPSVTKKVIVKKKKGGKPVLSAKEKKERGIIMEKAINALPLEFRGGDPTLRRNAESVIEGLLDAGQNGVKITDLIRPDCNQARVNKCLIAMVNRKIVNKTSKTGVVLYHWVGLPS